MRTLPFVLLLLVVPACGGPEPAPPADPLRGWTLDDRSVRRDDWIATLRGANPGDGQVQIRLAVLPPKRYPGYQEYGPNQKAPRRSIHTRAGTVVAFLGKHFSAEQEEEVLEDGEKVVDPKPAYVPGVLYLWHLDEEKGTELRIRRELPRRPPLTVEQALDNAETDPVLPVLESLITWPVPLDERVYPTGFGEVEASVNGGPNQPLERIRVRNYPTSSFALPAKPGDRVRITVRDAGAERVVVTSHGIRRVPAEVFPPNVKARLSWKPAYFATYDSTGVATFEEIRIRSPRLIHLNTGTLFLRWGHPEERWLNECDFPLVAPEAGGEARALLNHLEAAWNEDRGYLTDHNGRTEGYTPRWSEIEALNGLDLSSHPRLAALSKQIGPSYRFGDFCDQLSRSPPSPEIFVEATGTDGWPARRYRYTEEFRWHTPRSAYVLSVLHERRPDLREKNALPRILEFWRENMATHPDPLMPDGKWWDTDDRLESRLFAIAVLRRAAEAGDAECVALAEAQWKRTKEVAEKIGIGRALREHVGIKDRWKDRIAREVGVYGQICLLIGDDEGLEAARAWVRAALHRKGGDEGGPFANYREASFGDRLVLLGMMNGKMSLLTPPPMR